MLQILNLISMGILISIFSSFARAIPKSQLTDPAYRIAKMSLTDVTESFPNNENFISSPLMDGCNNENSAEIQNKHLSEAANFADLTTATGQLSVFIDQVINIGEKIWAVIAKGEPVINIKLASASAVPKGITCWTQLQGWSAPRSKLYRVKYENVLGSTVVDFTFRVISIYGGNYQGNGKYITRATIQVANLRVDWRFDFDVNVDIPIVYNRGTTEDPLGALEIDINWKVKSIFSPNYTYRSFLFNWQWHYQSVKLI